MDKGYIVVVSDLTKRKHLQYRKKMMVPEMEPWGIPPEILAKEDEKLPTSKNVLLLR